MGRNLDRLRALLGPDVTARLADICQPQNRNISRQPPADLALQRLLESNVSPNIAQMLVEQFSNLTGGNRRKRRGGVVIAGQTIPLNIPGIVGDVLRGAAGGYNLVANATGGFTGGIFEGGPVAAGGIATGGFPAPAPNPAGPSMTVSYGPVPASNPSNVLEIPSVVGSSS